MKVKVSVLIPVYGVEKYLDTFLQSLTEQSLLEAEFLIVNDASPDRSHEIIQKYIKKDDRFIYINKKENEGLYKARQDAFNKANGEYVINIDSDDYISSNFLADMYNFSDENKLDIAVSNVSLVDEDGKPINNSKAKSYSNDIIFSDENMISLLTLPYATWCRMYKRELLVKNSYQYEKGELFLTNFHFIDTVRSGLASNAEYFYRIRNNSMSSTSNSSKKLQNKLTQESIINFKDELISLNIQDSRKQVFNLFNYLSFSKLNFISCVYGCEVKRYKVLKNNINNCFPTRNFKLFECIALLPRELMLFLIFDKLRLTPVLLFIKSKMMKK